MSAVATPRATAFVDPGQRGAVAFRNLRTSTDLSASRRGSVALLFTSAHPGDGTSTIASNHAVLASAAGRSTLLIDANLWRPVLDQRLKTERRPGLTDVAMGEVPLWRPVAQERSTAESRSRLADVAPRVVTLEDAIQTATVGTTELSFLAAGATISGTVDILSSQSMTDLISEACRMFDTVVIDSSPVLAVADAAVLGAHPEVDTIVVVARHQRRKRVTKTISQLRRAGANVLGIVINAG